MLACREVCCARLVAGLGAHFVSEQVAVSKGSCARLEAENEALRGGRMTVTPTAQRAMSRQSKAGPQGQGLKMSVSSSGGKLAMSPAKQGVTGGIVPPGGKEARPKVAKAVLPEVPETPPHARGHASGNEGNAEAHTDTSPLPLGHADAPGGGGSPTPSGEGYADLSVSINEGDAAMQSPAKTYGGHLSPRELAAFSRPCIHQPLGGVIHFCFYWCINHSLMSSAAILRSTLRLPQPLLQRSLLPCPGPGPLAPDAVGG